MKWVFYFINFIDKKEHQENVRVTYDGDLTTVVTFASSGTLHPQNLTALNLHLH